MKIRYTQKFKFGIAIQKVFTIEEIESGLAKSWLDENYKTQQQSYEIFRDRFTGIRDSNKRDIYENDIFADSSRCIFEGLRFIKIWKTKDNDGNNHWEDLCEGFKEVVVSDVYKSYTVSNDGEWVVLLNDETWTNRLKDEDECIEHIEYCVYEGLGLYEDFSYRPMTKGEILKSQMK